MDDRYQKLVAQVDALQQEKFADLDTRFLIDELLAMARSDKRAVKSYLRQLITRLIKINCAKTSEILDHDRYHWQEEINNVRSELNNLFEESPSLRQLSEAEFNRIIQQVKRDVVNLGFLDQDCVQEILIDESVLQVNLEILVADQP